MRRQLSALAAYSTSDEHYMGGDLSAPEMVHRMLSERAAGGSSSFRVLESSLGAPSMMQSTANRLRGAGEVPLRCASDPIDRCAAARELLADGDIGADDVEVELLAAMAASSQAGGHLAHTSSIQSVNLGASELAGSASDITDSPRSLDHYYGFGANYHRRARAYSTQQAPHLDQLAGPVAYAVQPPPPPPRSGSQSVPPRNSAMMHQQQQQPQISAGYAPMNPAQLQQQQQQLCKPPLVPVRHRFQGTDNLLIGEEPVLQPPAPPARRTVSIAEPQRQEQQRPALPQASAPNRMQPGAPFQNPAGEPPKGQHKAPIGSQAINETLVEELPEDLAADQQSSSATEQDKWSDSEADAIVRGAKETAQMALSMYQFTRGEGDLNTTQDLFTQAELFAEEANELYKEVRCFSYKVSPSEPPIAQIKFCPPSCLASQTIGEAE